MQLGQPSQDALVSFSDFLLEKFGLVATMQVAVLASIAFHTVAIVGLGFKLPSIMREDAPHNMMDVVLVNSRSPTKPVKADALAQANLDGGGNTDEKLRAKSPLPALEQRQTTREMHAAEGRVRQLEAEAKELMTRMKSDARVEKPETQPPGATQTDKAAQGQTKLFGETQTRLYALMLNATHDGEHYGNMVTYLRLNGIVPPSSRKQ